MDGIGKGSSLVVGFGLRSPWRQWASGLRYGLYMETVIPGNRNVAVEKDGEDQLDRFVKTCIMNRQTQHIYQGCLIRKVNRTTCFGQ